MYKYLKLIKKNYTYNYLYKNNEKTKKKLNQKIIKINELVIEWYNWVI